MKHKYIKIRRRGEESTWTFKLGKSTISNDYVWIDATDDNPRYAVFCSYKAHPWDFELVEMWDEQIDETALYKTTTRVRTNNDGTKTIMSVEQSPKTVLYPPGGFKVGKVEIINKAQADKQREEEQKMDPDRIHIELKIDEEITSNGTSVVSNAPKEPPRASMCGQEEFYSFDQVESAQDLAWKQIEQFAKELEKERPKQFCNYCQTEALPQEKEKLDESKLEPIIKHPKWRMGNDGQIIVEDFIAELCGCSVVFDRNKVTKRPCHSHDQSLRMDEFKDGQFIKAQDESREAEFKQDLNDIFVTMNHLRWDTKEPWLAHCAKESETKINKLLAREDKLDEARKIVDRFLELMNGMEPPEEFKKLKELLGE